MEAGCLCENRNGSLSGWNPLKHGDTSVSLAPVASGSTVCCLTLDIFDLYRGMWNAGVMRCGDSELFYNITYCCTLKGSWGTFQICGSLCRRKHPDTSYIIIYLYLHFQVPIHLAAKISERSVLNGFGFLRLGSCSRTTLSSAFNQPLYYSLW